MANVPCPCVLLCPLFPGLAYGYAGESDGWQWHEMSYRDYVYSLPDRFRPMLDVPTCPVHHPKGSGRLQGGLPAPSWL